MFFSAANNGFYDESLKEIYYDKFKAWPEDAVSLTDAEITEFYVTAPPEGKILGASENGRPVWDDLPPRSATEVMADSEQKRNALRSVADAELAWLQDAVEAGMATDEEAAELSEWKKYRVLLMRVDTAAPVWPTPPERQG
ncbi:tail fiber assembly protein [Escherichia coli]|uniref:tail fiber assembly protein n=1 Tax=Escherichia coli TaxID=562 RepID=UPI000BE3D6C2|nr:tail fiber assembly protein [Escherichia coli]EFB5497101.1 tail fiber assembly protein [Escherichia coli]EID2629789.1 tail fiber assembly protein [Escherichia coli]HBN0179071.1 tail fiber assembly protein [Escherichia coli]